MYKILGIAFLFVAVPVAAYWFQLWFYRWNKRNILKLRNEELKRLESYTKEQYEKNFKEYYNQTTKLFNQKIKSKSMNRSNILAFKKILDKCLARYKDNYQDHIFQNDAHEIYAKLKDIHLDKSDFNEMINYLNSL